MEEWLKDAVEQTKTELEELKEQTENNNGQQDNS